MFTASGNDQEDEGERKGGKTNKNTFVYFLFFFCVSSSRKKWSERM